MTTQSLGRFGRLRQTLLDKTMNENLQQSSIFTTVSCDTKDTTNPSESSDPDKKEHLVFEWLKVCVEEGHIEPSQPTVGRICGWPLRSFLCESLFIDFECWCSKKGIHPKERPGSKTFYSLTDSIFDRNDDKYHFPSLEQCRQKFKSLIGNKLNV
jgi:hypothetical protein